MKLLNNNEWNNYFNERSKVRLKNFNFKGKEKSYGYSRALAINLQRNYPRQNFLEYHGGLLFEYNYELIQKFLGYLTDGNNCYYQLISKDFENECKETEEWYGTKFKTEKEFNINDIHMNSNDENNNNKLYTPLENKYIADDFTIICDGDEDVKNNDMKAEDVPYVIRETDCSKIWFKMDKTFKKPKLCVSVICYSPLFNDIILSQCLMDLIILILNDELSDLTYAFEEASLSFNILFNGSNGIQFKFLGQLI